MAWKLRQLEAQVPAQCEDGLSSLIEASSSIINNVIDNPDALEVILLALKAAADPAQIRELIEENGRLKRELDEENARLRRELNEAAEREAKMMVRIAELTPEPVEDEPDEEEPKKKRASNGWHRWTDEEDAWIANHLNSATSRDVAERFGVSPKAAYTRMLLVKERLGK